MIPCMIGTTEIILILVFVLLLFGGKKVPELMKGLGKGVRSFKEGMTEPSEEDYSRKIEEEIKRLELEKRKAEVENKTEYKNAIE